MEPGAQKKQFPVPAADHLPTGQFRHAVLFVSRELEYVPPGHIVHDVA
jgi:hypothetical protein